MPSSVIYLEPLDSYTNQAFHDFPLDCSLITQVRVAVRAEPVMVWEATEAQYEYLRKSRDNSNLKFNAFELYGKTGYVRRINPSKGKSAKIQAARKVAEMIR